MIYYLIINIYRYNQVFHNNSAAAYFPKKWISVLWRAGGLQALTDEEDGEEGSPLRGQLQSCHPEDPLPTPSLCVLTLLPLAVQPQRVFALGLTLLIKSSSRFLIETKITPQCSPEAGGPCLLCFADKAAINGIHCSCGYSESYPNSNFCSTFVYPECMFICRGLFKKSSPGPSTVA